MLTKAMIVGSFGLAVKAMAIVMQYSFVSQEVIYQVLTK